MAKVDELPIQILLSFVGDVKTKWKSAIRHQQQQICNSLRANHYIEGGSNGNYQQQQQHGGSEGELPADCSLTDAGFPYDNISQSSYGSHKNRNFESRSHRGSIDELRNHEENEKLVLLMMNGGGGK